MADAPLPALLEPLRPAAPAKSEQGEALNLHSEFLVPEPAHPEAISRQLRRKGPVDRAKRQGLARRRSGRFDWYDIKPPRRARGLGADYLSPPTATPDLEPSWCRSSSSP